jgi:hypothetical protein
LAGIPLAILLIAGGLFQFFAGVGALDAPTWTPFGCAGRANPREPNVADVRMDRVQVGGESLVVQASREQRIK